MIRYEGIIYIVNGYMFFHYDVNNAQVQDDFEPVL